MMIPQPVEPAASLIAMTQAVVGHRQQRPIAGTLPPPRSRMPSSSRPERCTRPAAARRRAARRSVPQPRRTDN